MFDCTVIVSLFWHVQCKESLRIFCLKSQEWYCVVISLKITDASNVKLALKFLELPKYQHTIIVNSNVNSNTFRLLFSSVKFSLSFSTVAN